MWGENVNRDDYCEGKTLLLLDGRINQRKYLDSGPFHTRMNVVVDSEHPRSNQLKIWRESRKLLRPARSEDFSAIVSKDE